MDRADRPGSEDECFRFFESEVQNHFYFVNDIGCEGPQFTREHNDLLGDVMNATYSSPTRTILISVVKPSENRRNAMTRLREILIRVVKPPRGRRNAMIIFVSRLPRKDVDDNLEITLFAEKYRPDLAEAIDRFQKESPTTESFMRSVFPIYASLLREEAREIITGQRWEVGFYSAWT